MTEILAALAGAAVVLAGTVATGLFNLKSVNAKSQADLTAERERLKHAAERDSVERLSTAARDFYREWTAARQIAESEASRQGSRATEAWMEGVGPLSSETAAYRDHRAKAHASAAELSVLSSEVGEAAVRLLNEQPMFYEATTENYFDALRAALSSE